MGVSCFNVFFFQMRVDLIFKCGGAPLGGIGFGGGGGVSKKL